MVSLEELNNYHIMYDRMANKYIIHYSDLEEDIYSIKVFSSLLLNNVFLDESDIDSILLDIDDSCFVLRTCMYEDDYFSFIFEFTRTLRDMTPELLEQEKFEGAVNINNFIDAFDILSFLNKNKED